MEYYNKLDVAKLYYGESLKILKGIKEKSIDMIFSDPPYFLSNDGITCSGGKMVSVNKGNWDKSLGYEKDLKFHRKWLKECDRILKEDGTMWISGTYHSIYQIVYILNSMGYYIINEVVWYKPNAAPNLGCRCLTASHETLIWAKKNKKAKHTFNYDVSKMLNDGKQMRSFWSINTTPKKEKTFGKHPTQKPLELLERVIKISTKENDTILDPFCGSSTTGVAAILNNRRYIGIDNSKEYIELSKRRLQSIEIQEELMKNVEGRPILKWAGGKSKLIPEIEERFPKDISNDKIKTYVEPFIGGGAVFFHVASKYKFERLVINDINSELILTYNVIKTNVTDLILVLEKLQSYYNGLDTLEEKQEYFYEVREEFNKKKGIINYNSFGEEEIKHAAHMIFLNKSCFNGLYRENKKGGFNVPFGKKEKINIFDKENILAVSKTLKNAIILNGDFEGVKKYIDKETFVYMDPPYRPLLGKGNFKDYSKEEFNDETQKRLAEFCKDINNIGAKFIESNSDPKNADEEDNFFDDLYSEFYIDRIKAARNINSNGRGRGKVSEILIKNY